VVGGVYLQFPPLSSLREAVSLTAAAQARPARRLSTTTTLSGRIDPSRLSLQSPLVPRQLLCERPDNAPHICDRQLPFKTPLAATWGGRLLAT
jgi:hypothetical protein